MKKLNIGFIGNFIPTHSTENDRKWSLEKLGHNVITFQENLTTAQQLVDMADNLDLLLYSHTHDPSYIIPNLMPLFRQYKEIGIPTASVHLDRWAGLNRQSDMGVEATWFTEYIFMADGSPEAEEIYNKMNLNWHYLAPGVVERDVKIVPSNLGLYPHQIVFTGSKGYHPEYPFRRELVDFLKRTYPSFGHYGNDGIQVVRGEALNTLYSSSLIVVGDSCFGGRPRYTSDRYYEVRGRGGFLIHPHVEGVESHGVANYEAGNLQDLKAKIDYYLENSFEREEMRMTGFNYVKDHATYTLRAKEMLEIIFGKENQ